MEGWEPDPGKVREEIHRCCTGKERIKLKSKQTNKRLLYRLGLAHKHVLTPSSMEILLIFSCAYQDVLL